MNQLYYGDNLLVLRDQIADESVDLIYLDPPFNSKRDYNLLFKSPKGAQPSSVASPAGGLGYSAAQIEAFLDTWHWTQEVTEREYEDVLKQKNTDVAQMMKALVGFLGRNDMTAYLVMMAGRLLELHRVLKPTGSLYLHCDPTASHYLKIVLDAVFGKTMFKNDIVWKRASAHNDPSRCGNIHDDLFFYTKGDTYTWNRVFTPYTQQYIDAEFTKLPSGRFYKAENMLDPRNSMAEYDFMGTVARWRTNHDGMMELWNAPQTEVPNSHGRIKLGKNGKPTKRCRIFFLDDLPGVPLQSIWDDVISLRGGSDERLGYPTQKPLALLERIIAASSNAGDVVLDPFCGCGTAVHAAQKLKRQWIGIDITCLAIALIESRLKKAFPESRDPRDPRRLEFDVIGTPKDLESARDLARRDKYQFQYWALSLIDEAQPWQGKKKGADTGIDGVRYFRDLDRKEIHTILISVKGGESVGPAMVKDLIATLSRDKADIGLFLTLAPPTKAMLTEAAAAGFYESPNGKKYARLQLLTIEGLLDKTQRAEHPDYEPDTGYKKARAEAHGEQPKLL